jgi:dTDP-4-amino-4,6-dideoxygalactose transaminase
MTMPVSGSDIGERPSEKIPSIDLAAGYPALKEEIEAVVASVLASGRYVGGPEVEGLEREFASYCGARDAVAVGSGTDSLRFTLIALGIGSGARGDGAQRNEVVTSPFSFAATTEAISQAGGRPVFSDIDPETFNLDPAGLEEALTPRTRAILPVHLYGHPADMPPILDLAARRDLAVVEDACQAHGAFHQESRTGSIGDAGCFSFYPTKNLGACGEGGMVTTSRPEVAAGVRRLRDHGQDAKYHHIEEGFNGRLDALQAAILRLKLRRLDDWNGRRRAVAARYRDALQDVAVTLPVERSWARHVYHQFTVRVEKRDAVRDALARKGVDAGVHYPIPLHLQPCYAWMGLKEGSFPHAERAAREVLTLPVYPELNEAQIDRVCEVLRETVGTR